MWEGIKMNDILHDIKKLTDIKESVGLFSTSTIQSLIQDLINEKQSIVTQFEKQAELGEDWEYERGGEQTLYDDVPIHIIELNKKLKGEI